MGEPSEIRVSKTSVFEREKGRNTLDNSARLLASKYAILRYSSQHAREHCDESLQGERVVARIFLSYAREDERQVRDVYRRLLHVGFDDWMNKIDCYLVSAGSRKFPMPFATLISS